MLAGRALFERDSLLEHRPITCWPLMFALRDVQSHGVAHPTVLDFGGGLGSVFFQHRSWWTTTAPITWNVVELWRVVMGTVAPVRFVVSRLAAVRVLDASSTTRRRLGIVQGLSLALTSSLPLAGS